MADLIQRLKSMGTPLARLAAATIEADRRDVVRQSSDRVRLASELAREQIAHADTRQALGEKSAKHLEALSIIDGMQQQLDALASENASLKTMFDRAVSELTSAQN